MRYAFGSGNPGSSSLAGMGNYNVKLTLTMLSHFKVGQQRSATLIRNRHTVCNTYKVKMMMCNRFMTPLFFCCNLKNLVPGALHGLQGGRKHLRRREGVAKIQKVVFLMELNWTKRMIP